MEESRSSANFFFFFPQFAFFRLKRQWKGAVWGVMAALTLILIGWCWERGIGLRTDFSHWLAMLCEANPSLDYIHVAVLCC